MPAYTVITPTWQINGHLSGSPLAAIPAGVVHLAGSISDGVHKVTVHADDADAAMEKVATAIAVLGGIPKRQHAPGITATRWTVIGTADNGVCSSWRVVAVIAGEHEVEGRWDSMLSHRWAYVVDAADAQAAEDAGYAKAAERYEESWD